MFSRLACHNISLMHKELKKPSCVKMQQTLANYLAQIRYFCKGNKDSQLSGIAERKLICLTEHTVSAL